MLALLMGSGHPLLNFLLCPVEVKTALPLSSNQTSVPT